MTRRLLIAGAAAAAAIAAGVGTLHDVSACGGLVAPNGAVRLARASTAIGWHDGVEHYLTSFSYQGNVPDIGWIVPLPAVPDSVVKGGSWSLQRMSREARPVRQFTDGATAGAALAAGTPAEVLLQTTVDSLDITVIKGSGDAVAEWCAKNGFTLNTETRDHIIAYAMASPIFLAAKYDTNAARARGFFQGDGTPVLITMHTPRMWVPLEVLANNGDSLNADVFLFTDERPSPAGNPYFFFGGATIPGASGFQLLTQEAIPRQLHDDLAAEKNMEWVPSSGWFTALTLDAKGQNVTYDMTVDRGRITLAPMGLGPDAAIRAAARATPGAVVPAVVDPGVVGIGGTVGSGGTGMAVMVAGASIVGSLLLAAAAAWAWAFVERRRLRRVR